MKLKTVLQGLCLAAIVAAVFFFRQGTALGQVSDDKHSFKFSRFDFSFPSTWQVMTPRPTEPDAVIGFVAPTSDNKESAQVIFFLANTPSGQNTMSAMTRWTSRFTEGKDKINYKEQPIQISDQKLTVYTADGTYKENSTATPKRDYGLSCFVLTSETQTLFIRTMGPTNATSSAASEVYHMLLNSIR